MMHKKKNVSIRTKMFFQISSILISAVLLILLLNTTYLGDIYLYNQKQDMKKSAVYIDNLDIKSGLYYGTVTSMESEKNITIDIFDLDGTPLYTGSSPLNISGKAKILETSKQKDGSVIEIYEIDQRQYIFLKKDLSFGGQVEILSSKDVVDSNATTALFLTYGSLIFILLLSFVFVFIYTKRFTKPLIVMSKITENMANMDFSQKCAVKSNDEIGTLSSSINNLSISLDSTLKDLNEKNRQLSDDIEKKKKIEQMRKEFISNISHELKTPIAIIKGYAEASQMMIQSGDTELALEYCDIINKESDKMTSLVYELLELSRYELQDNQLNEETFYLNTFIDDYMTSEKIIFEEKKVKYEEEIPQNALCKGDIVKLTMVLNNYVSNALSHIANEKIIKIFCEDDNDFYKISVFNTGENISEEDLENIWKSFYRADKSHSRKEGRYGLGLSIVSAIQKLHKADYGVYNTEKGVVFWFQVKKA